MVLETSHSWRLIGALFGVAVAAVATGGVVQPMLSQCGAMPTDCNTYQCNTATGEWRLTGKKVNGAACNDGSVCTTGDKCQSGACVGTPPVTNDSNTPTRVPAALHILLRSGWSILSGGPALRNMSGHHRTLE